MKQELSLSLKEYSDIISNAGLGVWHIILKDGEEPRMQVNAKMAELLGIAEEELTEEETYHSWYDNIMPDALESVNASVGEMISGRFSENTYQWKHPLRGIIYVRCGGTAFHMLDGTTVLRGYHADVTDIVLKEKKQTEILLEARKAAEERNCELAEQLAITNSIVRAFNVIYYVNLRDYSYFELGVNLDGVHNVIQSDGDAREGFAQMLKYLVDPEMVEDMRAFTDVSTLRERLAGKSWIAQRFSGPVGGWSEGIFIPANCAEDGSFDHVIWATRSVDEDKKEQERLLLQSNTDELTGLANRRAYEDMIEEYEKSGIPKDLIYVSMDMNGLKNVNDSLGHAAGDELIKGTAECLQRCFGSYGKLFRTGGDEFVALIFSNPSRIAFFQNDITDLTDKWEGSRVKGASISCGFVARGEKPEASIREIADLADRRMYEDKNLYYQRNGIDRRMQKEAYSALCKLYTKILKINLTTDSFEMISVAEGESPEKDILSESISQWMKNLAESGRVHPDDVEHYLKKTDLSFLRKYFKDGNQSLSIVYRRKREEGFKNAIFEMIPANDYQPDSQSLFLFVKWIE